MNTKNLIFTLDSYKQLHDCMYPEGTENVYSYFESRKGGKYYFTTFFGLQYIIKEWLEGVVITKKLIDEAEPILKEHFKFCGNVWKRNKWDYIINRCNGKLPVSIKAVPEGLSIPENNILMSIENTDKNCWWLTNALETVLQQVWYPTTVCTRSNRIAKFIRQSFEKSVSNDQYWLADYYHHDFAQRSVTCMEQAGIGGMAHLVNSKGTDTDMSMPYAIKYYNADITNLAYSVPASEHSIATSLGEEKEFEITKRLIKLFPEGILSVVSDSYDIERAVNTYCNELKPLILSRNGKFVIRPDSSRFKGDTPSEQVLWIAQTIDKGFGSTINEKGYKVINPKIGEIYGDGLDEEDIVDCINTLMINGYAASTCVYGQGSGLLQKMNRDTCRFAFKSSAQCRNGVWYDIYKKPKDESKASKKGRLKLVRNWSSHKSTEITVPESDIRNDELVEVFRNGILLKEWNFEEIRNRAKCGG
jgi:nicotinamide phosphoribosyltransferase